MSGAIENSEWFEQQMKLLQEENQKDELEQEQARIERERKEAEAKERLKQRDAMPYSDRLATEICERISSGELLTVICNDAHMPTARNVVRMLKAHNDFAALYNMALCDRLTIFEEQIIQFGDDKSRDVQRATASSTKEKIQFVDPVQRAKLQIEVRMKHLRAGRPAKWGDVSTLITKESDPYDVSGLSAEEIEARIAEIEAKERIVRSGNRPLNVKDMFA